MLRPKKRKNKKRLYAMRLAGQMLATAVVVATAHLQSPAAAQTAAEARDLRPVTDILERLRTGQASLTDAKALLGTARTAEDGRSEFSIGGYLIRVHVSDGNTNPNIPPGVVLGVSIEPEKPRRLRDLNPVALNGYWTPKSCDPAGACKFEFGTDIPLHLAKLRDLALNRGCAPALRGDAVVRYGCPGGKANGSVDIEVEADLKFGLKNDMALRAERAMIMMKIRLIENDPNNPDRGGAAAWRRQFGIMGPITNEAIWNLVQELPVAVYALMAKGTAGRR